MNNISNGEALSVDETKNHFIDTELIMEDISNTKVTSMETETGEQTVRRVLGSYEIGFKLRQLRLRKKIALVDLGKHTGLSASMLSQLENGKLIPTLPTLARIAMVFDVGLEHFFADKRLRRTFSIVRAEERLKFPDRSDSPVPGYFFEVLAFGTSDKSMSSYLAEFPKRSSKDVRQHVHDGSEFVHLLEGTLAIHYQSEDHILNAGDSVYFDASEAHSYCGQSENPVAKAIVITTPPRM